MRKYFGVYGKTWTSGLVRNSQKSRSGIEPEFVTVQQEKNWYPNLFLAPSLLLCFQRNPFQCSWDHMEVT